jgi:hypothetical protein
LSAPQAQCTARERDLGLSRPNGAPWNTSWQAFSAKIYAGYIVGYDHKKELGSYFVRYDDGDHRHFKKGQLDEYRNYYEIMRNCSQPLVPEQPHDADDQARDPNLALFADLVTVPGTYADTVLNVGGFAFLAQLSQGNRLFVLRICAK